MLPKPRGSLSLAHLGSHGHPGANQSAQEDGRPACRHLVTRRPLVLGVGVGWRRSVRPLTQWKGGCVPSGKSEVDTHRQKSRVLMWFLIPEQESEAEHWDMPPPRPRAPNGQRRVFSAGLPTLLLRERGLRCFPCETAVRSAGGLGSWVEVFLQNGSPHLCPPKSNP